MSDPTLRDAVNNMPSGPMRQLYEQVLTLRLYSLIQNPDLEKVKKMIRKVAGEIESACDELCGEALLYEGKAGRKSSLPGVVPPLRGAK